MDEMIMAMAREYFVGMDVEEKKELLHAFLDMLSSEEKGEVLGMLFEEFSKDKKMLSKIKTFAKQSGRK